MTAKPSFLILALLPLLGGCVARAAMDVVTAPVRIAAKGVDAVTTSQSEADEKRGRALRKHDERMGKLSHKRDKLARACRSSEDACQELQDVEAEMERESARQN
jgi:hypothetical protein